MPVRLPNPASAIAGNLVSMASGLRDAMMAIRQLAEGRGNVSGTVTLTAGATTTVVTHPAIGRDAAIVLDARTANAAAALGTTYVSAQDSGTFTLTHANAGTVDRTFRWCAAGG